MYKKSFDLCSEERTHNILKDLPKTENVKLMLGTQVF